MQLVEKFSEALKIISKYNKMNKHLDLEQDLIFP